MSEFAVTSTQPQLLIPRDALSQSTDGDWQVFIESKPNHFIAKEVGVNTEHGEKVAITGIRIGEKIVTQGVFFLNAQAKKSSFDVHNH